VNDYLARSITRDGHIRGLACQSRDLVEHACRRHGTYPTACAALGRALTGGALMGALLKTRERVALKFEGNGPLKKVLVEADSNGTVRGYVRVPEVHLRPREDKLDVAGAVGRSGLLTVVKDLRMKEPYTGVVPLYSGEIAEDLAYYLTESEQIPSAVGLGVFVEPEGVASAGGFLVQSFPGAREDEVESVIEKIQNNPSITELLRSGNTPEDILAGIFQDLDFDIIERRPLAFRCNCSRERVERALISLGPSEISTIIEEQGDAEVTCEFCRQAYSFSREELEQLVEEQEAGSERVLH